MTSSYSIELEAEKINHPKTKEYFKEVLSSYINGNYRSALVSLWTITVCDLVYKLQDLSDIYEDTDAEKILKKIENLQKKDPKNSSWEGILIEEIEKKQMFETYQIADIESLHTKRHLSAHPVIKNNLELYKPNKETVRAFIRNTLESVLTVPSTIVSKKDAFNYLIRDIKIKKEEGFLLTSELKDFFNKRFFSNYSKPVTEYVFKELWKFVFKLDNEDIEKNLKSNFDAMDILYKENQELLNTYIKNNRLYFSEKTDTHKKLFSQLLLVRFMSDYPKVYTLFDETLQKKIQMMIDSNKEISLASLFLKENPQTYLKEIEENIDIIEKNKHLSKWILHYSKENEIKDELISIYLNQYIESSSYSEADNRFNSFIEPILNILDFKQIKSLLKKIEDNGEIYGRTRNIEETHLLIKERINNINDTFDYSPYPNFLRSIRWKEV